MLKDIRQQISDGRWQIFTIHINKQGEILNPNVEILNKFEIINIKIQTGQGLGFRD